MSDFVGAAINTAELTSKLTGIAVDFLSGIGCEAFCEVLDIGKDFLFEALRSGKINHQTKKALESLDQRTVDDLKHFVSRELEKYSKKGKLPKKLKGKDLVDVFMNRLDTVSRLVDDYAAQNNLSEDRKIALKYILNEIRQCTAQASLDMLEAEDKRLVLVISQIVRNTFEDYREDFAPQLAKTLFYRPTNCTYCASSSLLYDDAKGIASCKNCGTKIEYTKSEQPDLLAEAKAAFSGELGKLNDKLDKLMALSLQTLSAVQSIDGKVETVTRTSDLKSRLNLAQDRVNNYEFTEACNTCRAILKDYPNSVDALWCYLQAEFGIVYLRGYNESYAKPTFCYPMDRASKIRFCDHEYYKKIMLLLKDDHAQRSVYEARQREIDKAIATLKNDLSKKPEYDVFICVKIGLATDNNQVVDPNSKTLDFDQYAQRIYRELTSRGLRVFCSQISQAQGIAYDEQIWSAMLRSKKILVIGTRREYLESVWVQCEWRRWMYLRHIGVRAPDSFVALIPSEDEWSYIRPREWDEQRITIYTDIDSAINAIIDTPTATVPTNPDTQSRLIRDIRVLLDWDQNFSEAQERLEPLLRAMPSNGELRWLSLRVKSRDFTDLSKFTPQMVEMANRCLKDDGLDPETNPEYRMYLNVRNAEQAAQAAEAQRAEKARLAEEAQRAEEARKAEQERKAAEARAAEEASKAEAARKAEELRKELEARRAEKERKEAQEREAEEKIIRQFEFETKTENGKTYSILAGVVKLNGSDVVIPRRDLQGNPVIGIGESAFTECENLTSVTIPNSVTRIEEHAFRECYGLTSIVIPDSVTSIGDYAFAECSKLTGITIPDSVTSIGAWAFYDCTGLASITLSNRVRSIRENVFYHCTGLTRITVPNSVTSIGESAFQDCLGLTSITIPGSVTRIGNSVFNGCKGLKSITIPDSVRSIGEYAFYQCARLESVTLPNGLVHIGGFAFNSCTSLTAITIPESVTKIGDYAFWRCERLQSIALPTQLDRIGEFAFSWCKALKSVTVPVSVKTIGSSAFLGCAKLDTVYYTGSKSEWAAIQIGGFNDCLTNAKIHYKRGLKFPWW